MRSADVRLVALLFIAGVARAQGAAELTGATGESSGGKPGDTSLGASSGKPVARDTTFGESSSGNAAARDSTLGASSNTVARDAPLGESSDDGTGARDTTLGDPSSGTVSASSSARGSTPGDPSSGNTGAQVRGTAPPSEDAPRSAQPTRSARLLGESITVAGAGLVLPVVAYVGLTAGLQSFVGFFAGVLGGSVLGLVIAPIAVAIAHRLLGGDGGAGRAVLGALVGLAVGLIIGIPLATVPAGAYVVGLALAWVMPSVGAAIALELGSPPRHPQAGVVVARF